MINIGGKYQHKDGGVYEVVDYGKQTSPNGTYEDYVVWYCKVGETAKAYPRLESHFLDSFKPYEPIYEWQWAFRTSGNTELHHTIEMTENEFIIWQYIVTGKQIGRAHV